MSEVEKVFIKDLRENGHFKTIFLVLDKRVLKDKNGKAYMTLNLADVSGTINGRVWDKVEGLDAQFNSGDFVVIKGHVQMYQNRRQIVVHDLRLAQDGEYQMGDYMDIAHGDPQKTLCEVLQIVEEVRDPWIRQLMEASLKDPDIQKLLLKAPAAKTIHHAFVGGLLEHILSICKIMYFMAAHYPFLNRDYLVFGAVFHDLGKVWELEVEGGIRYTDRGRLIGHMEMACELIDRKAQDIEGFSADTRDLLKHIVLSHHGRYEYGSPRRPKFIEALVVAMVDELDSRIDSLHSFLDSELKQDPEARWTHYNGQFDRYFYLEPYKEQLQRLADRDENK